MLRVATPKMDTIKTDFPSKKQAHDEDRTGSFEDFLNSATAGSDDAYSSNNRKIIKATKSSQTDECNSGEPSGKQESQLHENVLNEKAGSDTFSKLDKNQAEKTVDTKTGDLLDGKTEQACISQLVSIIPVQTAFEQNPVNNTEKNSGDSSLAVQQVVSSAGDLLNSQQTVLANGNTDNSAKISVPDLQQTIPVADVKSNQYFKNSSEINQNYVLNDQAANEVLKADISTEEITKAPTTGVYQYRQDNKKTIEIQTDQDAVSRSGSVLNLNIQNDSAKEISKIGQQIGDGTQNASNINANNAILTNKDQTASQTVVNQNMNSNKNSANNSLKMEQTEIITKKADIYNIESKIKGIVSNAASGDSSVSETSSGKEQATEFQFFGNARVFSGKENGITAAVSQDNIINQVTNSVVNLSKSKNQRFTMELTPETLGKITIEMKYIGDRLEMKINADNPATAKVLSEKLAELKGALTSNDVNVSNIDVGNSSAGSSFTDLSNNFNHAGGQDRDTDSGHYRDKNILYDDRNVPDENEKTNENANIYYRQNQLLNYLV